MEKFTKYLCLSLLAAFFNVMLYPAAELHVKGDYFIYSDALDFIYGSGNITIKGKDSSLAGDVLYLDVRNLRGVIYGQVKVKTGSPEKKCDALFFTAFPLQLLFESFADRVIKEGDQSLSDILKKTAPDEIKKSDLHFEFREFRINKYKRIKARTIIPYIMGLPTLPIRSFVIRRGETPDRTAVSFKNLNYSDPEGLSLSFMLRLKEKFVKSDFDLKLYEKALLGLEDPKRGVLFSGSGDFLIKENPFLNFSTLLNSGEQSYNFSFNHRKDLKYFGYSLSQSISGREETQVFSQFASDVTLKKLPLLTPTFDFSHNLKKSYSYGISTPVKIRDKLGLNLRWHRRILKDDFESDTADFSTTLNFSSSIVNLSSQYNFSKNMLDAAVRKNFSINMRLNPMNFLDKNVSLDISSFYMFSDIPSGEESITRVSPGINVSLNSAGAMMFSGIKLAPSFTFNHIWDNREENFTDFNSQLSLEKEVGKFRCSLAYALVSRYRAKNFWVEGNNTQNMNVNLELIDPQKYAFYLRFYYNNTLNLENITLSGKVNLPFDLIFSSFVLYYNETRKFQTVEVFIEKKILHKTTLRGGYSLALRKFFIQVVSI